MPLHNVQVVAYDMPFGWQQVRRQGVWRQARRRRRRQHCSSEGWRCSVGQSQRCRQWRRRWRRGGCEAWRRRAGHPGPAPPPQRAPHSSPESRPQLSEARLGCFVAARPAAAGASSASRRPRRCLPSMPSLPNPSRRSRHGLLLGAAEPATAEPLKSERGCCGAAKNAAHKPLKSMRIASWSSQACRCRCSRPKSATTPQRAACHAGVADALGNTRRSKQTSVQQNHAAMASK